MKTGLCDSKGNEISIGDHIKVPTECNEDVHGSWSVMEIKQQGLTPIASYLYSEKGEILPPGHLAMPLCDYYNRKLFCFANDIACLRPDLELTILKDENEI